MSNDIKLEIENLKKTILKYDEEYFVDDDSNLEDPIYDQLLAKLSELEEKYPQYKTPNSPTQKVGGRAVNTFEQVIHKNPMQSLGKVLTKEEFKSWLQKMIDNKVFEFTAEYKFDGVAISNEYEDDKLIQSATRGDGNVGEDVTVTANVIPSIPKRVTEGFDFNSGVRGETYLKKSNLVKLNEEYEIELSKSNKYQGELVKKRFSNVRNAASGLLRRKEVTKENKYLSFIAYYLEDRQDFEPATYETQMKFLEKLGFETAYTITGIKVDVKELGSVDAAIEVFEFYFDEVEKNRDRLDYDIDGIVIKANKFEDQDRLGSKTNVPNWAIAYKFPAQEKIATLNNVVWTMGNKGNITPNARLEEKVELVGADVGNITLHNLEELKKLNIKIGDKIVVSRQGDVIPKVKRIISELRTGKEIEIQIPTHCPACGAPTVIKGAYLNCSAGRKCSYMTFARVQNFIVSMEIEEFGDVKIKELVDLGLVKDLADLYDKEIIDFENGLTRVGERTATKMFNNIQNSRNNDLWMVINGLTIDGVGKETAKDLAEKYKSLEAFINCKISELITIPGIAEKSAEKIVEWCQDEDNRKVVQKLIERKIGKMNVKVASSNKFEGYVFATSGKISIVRDELEKIITDNGGQFSSIKKGLTHFIAGDGAKQNKIDKALSYGAKIITGNEFLDMLK